MASSASGLSSALFQILAIKAAFKLSCKSVFWNHSTQAYIHLASAVSSSIGSTFVNHSLTRGSAGYFNLLSGTNVKPSKRLPSLAPLLDGSAMVSRTISSVKVLSKLPTSSALCEILAARISLGWLPFPNCNASTFVSSLHICTAQGLVLGKLDDGWKNECRGRSPLLMGPKTLGYLERKVSLWWTFLETCDHSALS
jgi:hypothetical protein